MTPENTSALPTAPSGRRHILPGLILAPALMLLATFQVSANDTDWELRSEEEQVLVYTRAVEGSDFHAVKATTRINAGSEQLSALMGDGSECAPWRAMCKSSRVLEVLSEQERHVYMVLDLPWPISDRDIVMKTTTTIDRESRTATIDLQSANIAHPPQKYVRAATSGQMKIAEIGPDQVEFTYIMHADLGGDLPASTVNSQLVERTHKDIRTLKKLAES
ncbi:MAG: START domain-containing protein [Halioglobus sp.]